MYLFILFHKTVSILIEANTRVKEVALFKYTYLHSAYADDSIFFLRDKRSINDLVNIFDTFSKYLGLNASHEKCEIVEKNYGIHFSYNN